MAKIRALIVDDEPLARAGIRELLLTDPDISIAGECRDGIEAIERLREPYQRTPSDGARGVFPLGSHPVIRFHDIAIVRNGSYAIVDISVNHRKTFRALMFYDWTAHAEWEDGHADPGDWMNEILDLSAYAGDTASMRSRSRGSSRSDSMRRR